MDRVVIEGTDQSPKVELSEGEILIEGKCYPENTFEFFEPIISWLEEYFGQDSIDATTFSFKLKYFNSATTQVIFDILDIIEENDQTKESVQIKWFYEEENGGSYEDYEDYADEFPDLNIEAVSY
jgi:hypothetical protein